MCNTCTHFIQVGIHPLNNLKTRTVRRIPRQCGGREYTLPLHKKGAHLFKKSNFVETQYRKFGSL